jgi:hypothetical protein
MRLPRLLDVRAIHNVLSRTTITKIIIERTDEDCAVLKTIVGCQ